MHTLRETAPLTKISMLCALSQNYQHLQITNNALLFEQVKIVLLIQPVWCCSILFTQFSDFGGHFVFIQLRESKLIHSLKNYEF